MDFNCLDINDIIKLIVIYEVASFAVTQSAIVFYNLLSKTSTYREFVKRNM